MTDQNKGIFRPEAIKYHNKGALSYGDILKLSPRWVNWAYPFLLVSATLLGIFLFNFSVDEFVSGAATLQITGIHELAADETAVVQDILVSPGQVVRAGASLLRLAKSEASQADLAEPELRAPVDGQVLEVPVAPGQKLMPGTVALVMSDSTTGFRVTGLLPGPFLPRVSLLQTARFRMFGQDLHWHDVKLQTIDERLMSPAEAAAAARLTGTELIGDQGLRFLVAGDLAAQSFLKAGQEVSLRDGLTGTIEVKVDSEPLIDSLLPALRMLKENRKRSDGDQ